MQQGNLNVKIRVKDQLIQRGQPLHDGGQPHSLARQGRFECRGLSL